MATANEQFSELVSLTQLFLLREFTIQDRIVADPETLIYFRKWVMQSKQLPPPPKAAPSLAVQAAVAVLQDPPLSPLPLVNALPEAPAPIISTYTAPEPSTYSQPAHVEVVSAPTPAPATLAKKVLTETRLIQFEPLAAPEPTSPDEFKSFFEKQFPQLILSDSQPDDALARKRKEAWKIAQQLTPILLLSFNDQENQLVFLKNIARAISLHLAPASVVSAHKIEQEKGWDQSLKTPHMKLIIASDYGLYMLPELMKHYKESAKGAKHALGTVPLLLLSDLSLYIKQPQLKPLLWRAICTEFSQK